MCEELKLKYHTREKVLPFPTIAVTFYHLQCLKKKNKKILILNNFFVCQWKWSLMELIFLVYISNLLINWQTLWGELLNSKKSICSTTEYLHFDEPHRISTHRSCCNVHWLFFFLIKKRPRWKMNPLAMYFLKRLEFKLFLNGQIV